MDVWSNGIFEMWYGIDHQFNGGSFGVFKFGVLKRDRSIWRHCSFRVVLVLHVFNNV